VARPRVPPPSPSSHLGRPSSSPGGSIGLSRCLFFPLSNNQCRPRGGERLHLTGILERAGATCPRPRCLRSLLRDLSGAISPPPFAGDEGEASNQPSSVCPSIPCVLGDAAARLAGRMKGRYRYRTRTPPSRLPDIAVSYLISDCDCGYDRVGGE